MSSASPEQAGRPAGRRPRIDDVGRHAGVSSQTVSRVLNGSPLVSQDARRRVEAAIAALHYRPSRAARALVTGRADVLGILTAGLPSFGTAAALAAFDGAASTAGLGMQVTCVPADDTTAMREAAERMVDYGVAGLAVQTLGPVAAAAVAGLDLGIPVIGLGNAGPHAPAVRIDHVAGAGEATRHLLAAGHRTVWHVAGPAGWSASDERAEGWRRALRAAGSEAPPVLTASAWGSAAGYAAGRVLRSCPGVTAVFAADDHLALGVLRALHEQEIDVPGEVAVVGFDDVPDAANFTPPLTTVRSDFDALGREAVDLLLSQLRSEAGPSQHRTIRPELVIRASSAAAVPAPG